MKTRVHRWGNSLAVRIPRSLAADAQLEQGTLVDLSLFEGRVVVRLIEEPAPTLDELLAGVTDDNLHPEWHTGPDVGREVV